MQRKRKEESFCLVSGIWDNAGFILMEESRGMIHFFKIYVGDYLLIDMTGDVGSVVRREGYESSESSTSSHGLHIVSIDPCGLSGSACSALVFGAP